MCERVTAQSLRVFLREEGVGELVGVVNRSDEVLIVLCVGVKPGPPIVELGEGVGRRGASLEELGRVPWDVRPRCDEVVAARIIGENL